MIAARSADLLLGRLELADGGHDRPEIRQLLGELGVGGLADAALVELGLDGLRAGDQAVELFFRDCAHGI